MSAHGEIPRALFIYHNLSRISHLDIENMLSCKKVENLNQKSQNYA